MKTLVTAAFTASFLAMALPVTLWAQDDNPFTAHALELALANDGVASLPVFKGPFPETENMRFLSQVDPEDLGALPVPGVWAKGMMNDLWGWT